MYHDHITLALAQAHTTKSRKGAADRRSPASCRPRYRLRALALGLAAITALAPAAALAQPTDSVPRPANKHGQAADRHHRPHAAPGSITFTNPLGRSRAPGAGAGLL